MDRDVKRHPIRGALWGLLFGFGLYFLLIGRKVFVVGSWTPVIISFVIGIVVNVAWAMLAPAKKAKPPKGMAMAPAEPVLAGAGAPMTAPVGQPAPAVPEPPAPPVPEPPSASVPPPPPTGGTVPEPPPPPGPAEPTS